MKRYVSIVLMVLAVAFASAQDLQTLAQRDISGSARYVGMAGAMSAIGHDASAVFDNPASLGTYDHFNVELTLDVQWNNATLVGSDVLCDTRANFTASSASAVFVTHPVTRKRAYQKDELTIVMRDVDVMRHAFFVGYRRLKNFQLYSNSALENPRYDGYMFSSTTLGNEESGYVNDFNFTWAMNYMNILYVGAGIDLLDYRYVKDMVHDRSYFSAAEYANKPLPMKSNDYDYRVQRNLMSGTGVSGRLGVMVRPMSWMTLAISASTPTAGKLKVTDKCELMQYIDTIDSRGRHYALCVYEDNFGGISTYNRKFSMPMNISSAVAFHLGGYADLSLQYDFAYRAGMDDIHSLRVGTEIRPVANWAIDLGYACTSTFKTPLKYVVAEDGTDNMDKIIDYINPIYDSERANFNRLDTDYRYSRAKHTLGVGFGYEGRLLGIRLAYQFNRHKFDILPEDGSFLQQEGEGLRPDMVHDLKANTHRLVLTLAFLH